MELLEENWQEFFEREIEAFLQRYMRHSILAHALILMGIVLIGVGLSHGAEWSHLALWFFLVPLAFLAHAVGTWIIWHIVRRYLTTALLRWRMFHLIRQQT